MAKSILKLRLHVGDSGERLQAILCDSNGEPLVFPDGPKALVYWKNQRARFDLDPMLTKKKPKAEPEPLDSWLHPDREAQRRISLPIKRIKA